MSDGGKGSAPRPFSVDQETYANNWDTIFKRKEKIEQENKRIESEVSGAINAQENRHKGSA